MSATARKTAPLPDDIRAMKGGTPIVSLTAYTTPMAQIMDPHCDLVLVGDSVGMVLHGMESTLGVTMDMIDRKSTRLNSSHRCISYAVFCLKKKKL